MGTSCCFSESMTETNIGNSGFAIIDTCGVYMGGVSNINQ